MEGQQRGHPKRLSNRGSILSDIKGQLQARGLTIAQAISQRELYFRVSLTGNCDLGCAFCHNEGASRKGNLDLAFGVKAMAEAFDIGFRRVQFTGGEPLLHPQVEQFVQEGRQIFQDVGITTNGTHLLDKAEALACSGITAVHVSLQMETLREFGSGDNWGVPSWLEPVSKYSLQGRFGLRLNLPVPATEMAYARKFLEDISVFGCDVAIFSILPKDNGVSGSMLYPIHELERLARIENDRRHRVGLPGVIHLRGYKQSDGIRCGACESMGSCREVSRSLRLGADRVLRPCLASRAWDVFVSERNMKAQMEEATLLALDYVW
jgi:cyclic pyranopterin phosphate synthase